MKTKIYNKVWAGVFSFLLPLSSFLVTSCSDDFLEVKNPTGEPLEEYYTNEQTLNEALTSAYAPW